MVALMVTWKLIWEYNRNWLFFQCIHSSVGCTRRKKFHGGSEVFEQKVEITFKSVLIIIGLLIYERGKRIDKK